ncbi:helix-turn-helix domain-containing protein [Argonema antarcticum]|uniref:helix-turn-helix domain-containing protein n=1 Tax=Argonema antarcticum TaxID=2942763 RepID=UPI002013B228|nr:helix-turn-helix domain-containing protein [Argonema antarcticum]MCL1474417.1 helix-turn-helix domain-containing protein [Argonema antarcticum A004/B2]
MKRNEVIELLGISDNTFRKWCKAHDIPTNKPKYTENEAGRLQDCQEKMGEGMKWDDYLASIGKAPQQGVAAGVTTRYRDSIKELAPAVAANWWAELDAAVADEIQKQAKQPSALFSKVLTGFSLAFTPSDDPYLIEGEIIHDPE